VYNATEIAQIPGHVEARAKLNLRLKVEGRRLDGYHLLSMINVTVAYSDDLTLQLTDDSRISVEIVGDVPGAKRSDLEDPLHNSAARAARSFLDGMKLPYGVRIQILKRIPAQAGLGGGSSDAAAVLRWLATMLMPELANRGFSAGEVHGYAQKVALGIGADVPYLLSGGFAHVKGIGENVVPLEASFLEGIECLLIHPPVRVSTPDLFQRLRTSEATWRDDEVAQRFVAQRGAPDARYTDLVQLVENDLAGAIFEFAPTIRAVYERLSRIGATVAGVTGSGSALFLLPRKRVTLPSELCVDLEQMLEGQDCRIVRTALSPGVVFDEHFL
jgi:4-diphosphocytidyl-2-C-methyl-D-erythritol kinase